MTIHVEQEHVASSLLLHGLSLALNHKGMRIISCAWVHRFPVSLVLAPHTHGRALLISRQTAGVNLPPALQSGDLPLSTSCSWLVVALLGSEKKTELLIFFPFYPLPLFPPLTFDL